MNKTYTPRAEEIDRRWYVVDATGQTLGRLASRIARVLEGKHKAEFASHIDTGDHVIVLNAARISVTRDKRDTKLYTRHSGYPQGLKQETLGELLARRPEEAIRRAVRGSMPRNRLGAQQLRKLKVYAGAEHPHEAQQPQPLDGSTSGDAARVSTSNTAGETDSVPTTVTSGQPAATTNTSGEAAPAATAETPQETTRE
jgi:large subunit ribosomal protein L13